MSDSLSTSKRVFSSHHLKPVVAALVATGFSSLAASAFAATFTVTNNSDSGAGSLRQAVQDANTNAGPDTIVFSAGLGTITLASTIQVGDVGNAALTINGNGVANTVISGGNAVRIFIATSSLSLNNLTLTNGRIDNGSGAAVIAEASGGTTLALSLNDILVSNNQATGSGGYGGYGGLGGAVAVDVFGYGGNISLDVTNSTFEGNSASSGGGAIYVGELEYGGNVSVTRSVFRNNSSGGFGGAVHLRSTAGASGSTITLDQLVVTNNSASYGGGGIAVVDPEAYGGTSVTRSYFSGNSAYGGGALFVSGPDVDVVIRNNTFVGNNSYGGGASYGGGGGAVYIEPQGNTVNFDHNTVVSNASYGGSGAVRVNAAGSGVVNLSNNILSGNTGGGTSPDVVLDVAGASNFTVANSIVSNASGEPDLPPATPLNGNIYNVPLASLNLGVASANGVVPVGAAGNQATALSFLPGAGSPALDAAGTSAVTIDQRGQPRPVASTPSGPLRSDIGAVEAATTGAARGPQIVPGVTGGLAGLMAAILAFFGMRASRRREK